jgi:hypothetical protein
LDGSVLFRRGLQNKLYCSEKCGKWVLFEEKCLGFSVKKIILFSVLGIWDRDQMSSGADWVLPCLLSLIAPSSFSGEAKRRSAFLRKAGPLSFQLDTNIDIILLIHPTPVVQSSVVVVRI